MTTSNIPSRLLLPHYRLIAYQRCEELLLAVRAAEIRDASLRDQALRAAKSACLNIIEAVGRTGVGDKKRVFGIARGEASEAAGAVVLAAICGEASEAAAERCAQLGVEVVAMLTKLAR